MINVINEALAKTIIDDVFEELKVRTEQNEIVPGSWDERFFVGSKIQQGLNRLLAAHGVLFESKVDVSFHPRDREQIVVILAPETLAVLKAHRLF